MCLAIPGRIIEITDRGEVTRRGTVDFEGIRKAVNLAFVPDADEGDYVLVHVGFAIETIDEDEARKVFATLRKMEELDDLDPDALNPTAAEP